MKSSESLWLSKEPHLETTDLLHPPPEDMTSIEKNKKKQKNNSKRSSQLCENTPSSAIQGKQH